MSGIRKVVLYKHGVGFFEREDSIEGNSELKLSFREAEMNDVLKSLTVEDLDGGSIQSVSYDTQKPIEKMLQESALQLPVTGGAAALLAKLRGANVRAQLNSRNVEGQIVGLDEGISQVDQVRTSTHRLTLLSRDGSITRIDIAEINKLDFLDETVRKELAFYYDTLAQGFKPGTKSLSIFGRGEGSRRLSTSYIVEAPVWKTSYRFLLPSDTTKKPFLEGWALVDNPQDEDWQDVELSLVAGLPISFVHDLYSPRYINRQKVEVQREAAAGPVVAAPGFALSADLFGGSDPFAAAEVAESCADDPFARGGGGDPFAASAAPVRSMAVGQRREAAVERVKVVSQSVGDLFEYKISHPVTVNRRQSALVPIAAGEFNGGRVILYNPKERTDNPFSAVEFHNTTGLTLEGGPVVVSEDEIYAGEAMLDTLKPGEMRLIPFAVELSVRVESSSQSREEEIHEIKGNAWALEMAYSRLQTTVYRFQSNASIDKTCWLEHPIQAGWELEGDLKPDETTATSYRFKFVLPKGATTNFEVKLRTQAYHSLAYNNLTQDTITVYSTRGFFDEKTKEQLAKVTTLVLDINQKATDLRSLEALQNTQRQDQERLRQNLAKLGSTSDEARLRGRYVAKLEEQENEFERMAQDVLAGRKALSEQQVKLQQITQTIQFVSRLRQ